MKISIFGLGYVGAVSVGCLARDGHHVVGVDIDPVKLELIRTGKTPIIEEGMIDLMADVAKTGRVEVSNDANYAVQNTDLSFICVGTPSAANGAHDYTALKRLAEQLGAAMKTKDTYHTFIVRSTVSPGTVEETVLPIIEKHSGKKTGVGFGIGFQPEFLREGTSIRDYDNPPYTIVGADSDKSVNVVREVFKHLPCEFISTSIRSAEMLKFCCNVFHALKITFANEVGRVCQGIGVNSHEVMDLVCRDTRLNISRAYMRPGFAFGGSCLPKDLRAMVHMAKINDVNIPMLGAVLPSNRVHIDHAIDFVLNSGKKRVGMIGLSFKTGTDDLRESPLVTLAERFIGKGLQLSIYDPEVNIARLIGANKRYIEESIPHISSLMRDNVDTVIRDNDVIIVGLGLKPIHEKILKEATAKQTVIDLAGMDGIGKLAATYHGACW